MNKIQIITKCVLSLVLQTSGLGSPWRNIHINCQANNSLATQESSRKRGCDCIKMHTLLSCSLLLLDP